MPISVRRELYVPAPDQRTSESRWQRYTHGTGLHRVEHRSLVREADWSNEDYERHSDDNGRTWGEWKDVHAQGYERKGEDEITVYDGTEAYNPRHGHFASVGMRRIFLGGHEAAFEAYWHRGESGFVDHTLMVVRQDGSEERSVELIKYEEGANYDPTNWRDRAYTQQNRAYLGSGIVVQADGQIVFPIAAALPSCCRILGRDVAELFPSCSDIMHGLIVARGGFDSSRGNYDLAFSRPVVIGDLKSSRGIDEPVCAVLPSGRIVTVFRGSNVDSPSWKTRIESGTPGHKWFCYSDDGGKTFTDPVPWHFDDREVFYSSATFHQFLRSQRNGKLYWIGNITDHTACGNYPRHPLLIAEVNERGLLAKSSLAIIDKREKGDSDKLQLSNFSVLQDRETGIVELYLSKLGQREGNTWWADCWRYFIDLEGGEGGKG
jgi:hypothetical protein